MLKNGGKSNTKIQKKKKEEFTIAHQIKKILNVFNIEHSND